ncbi:MAG TPA: carboxypeptidase-like regulatory domain-containing protein, partial [Chitinispirillaceae bacterium]|nr:carboxypeptidase-like regulatory domain-containing protein [Chitinispirillaceae bacterium]
GNYVITCEKTGFTSYSSQIDVMSSKSVSISMTPGAALVTGYVWGKTWVDTMIVYAPITNATLNFVNVSRADSFSVVTDNTYGDYKISLPGDQKYIVVSTANGFTLRNEPCTLATQIKTTQVFMDTLQGRGMIHGIVMLSTDRSLKSNVTINLMSTSTGELMATSKSATNGYYEIKNLVDGKYEIVAGCEGYVLDSIIGAKTIEISGGKATPYRSDILMTPGSKLLRWSVLNDSLFAGTIKLQSPLVKSIAIKDSLPNAGHGIYVIGCDAKQAGIIDLSYHRFSVPEDATVFIDTLQMDLRHSIEDTLVPVNGKVTVSITATSLLDSVYLFYKDPLWTTYSVEKIIRSDTAYTVSILPPKDGKSMQYYFKAWRGLNIYGYDKELYTAYVAPDLGSLSKIEVLPSTDDTLVYPSGYSINFAIKGYYSSTFILGEIGNVNSVSWDLVNAQGCVLTSKNGLQTTVKTGTLKSDGVVLLTISIDTAKIRMVPGAKNSLIVPFKVSGSALKQIHVKRTDAGNPNPIKNSSSDKAEFLAVGLDENGNQLSITPEWSVSPAFAGTIKSSGVFNPSMDYAGYVRIYAQSSGIVGEYVSDGSSIEGLNVRYMIMCKSTPDTAVTSQGCRIIFPAGIVKDGDVGILDFSLKELKNKIRRSTGLFKTVDTVAYEINEMENVAFNMTTDSIRIVMDVPDNYKTGKREMGIGHWDGDSLCWRILANSVLSSDKNSVSAALTHFSAYSLLVKAGTSMYVEINPNPFSPYVRPKRPQIPYAGTCISFQAESQERNLHKVNVKIYNVTGDLVWAISIPNANTNPYQVWWDGKTLGKEKMIEIPSNVIAENGDKMCRNGRYFVVVSTVDATGKEKRMMKQVVLLK